MDVQRGVVLRGLPFQASEDDVKTFFKSMDIPYENIRLIRSREGRTTGFGFVKLSSQDDVEHALLMDKNHIGSRYIEVYPSDDTELNHLLLMSRSGSDIRELNKIIGTQHRDVNKKDAIRRKLLTRFAFISGIPSGHQYKEVRKFFHGCLIGRNCIHLLKEPGSSEFSGEGYVEFADPEECRKGLKMDGQRMAGSVIIVEPCPEEEVVEVVGLDHVQDGGGRDRGGRGSSDRPSRRRDRTPSPASRRMLAYTKTYGGREDEKEYYHEREGRIHDKIASMAYGGEASYYHREPPPVGGLGHSYRERSPISNTRGWRMEEPATSGGYGGSHHSEVRGGYGSSPVPSAQHGGGYSSRFYEGGKSLASEDIRYGIGGGNNGGIGGASSLLGGYGGSLSMQGPSHAQLDIGGAERRVVRLEGLPYDVMVQEILDFFHGYHVSYENVRIQCRDDGSPSGKAFVTFPNEKLARHAVSDLNRHYIRGRFVELFIL